MKKVLRNESYHIAFPFLNSLRIWLHSAIVLDNLDIESVNQVHPLLQNLDTTIILVSHSPIEVLKLSSFVIAVEDKQIVQYGKLETVASRPATPWLSKFFDLNLISGRATGFDFITKTGAALQLAEPHSGEVEISFPSSAVSLHLNPPTGSPRNKWQVTVTGLTRVDNLVKVQLSGALTAMHRLQSLHLKNWKLR